MELTFVTDLGQSFVIEIDPNMELESVMALLEAESGISINEQSISFEGRDLSNPNATMASLGLGSHPMLLLRRKVSVAGRTAEQDAEMMRLQILGDPNLMAQLRAVDPALVEAAQSDSARFTELLRQTHARQAQAAREVANLDSNPYDIDVQHRIEEAIRQQAVMENFERALEYSPEVFGRVIMLYIPVEVNGHPIKAFVDSGAQQTIMSPECAEACGIMRLIDRRFSGVARGVGTARILGRIHSAPLKLADLFLPCSFTIMEGRAVDLLFGLDMLKAHQACIDLEKNVLRIQGREVKFLPEHELPKNALDGELAEDGETITSPDVAGTPGATTSSAGPSHFPGSGHTLGTTPVPLGQRASGPPAPAPTNHSEEAIQALMALGASRDVAIQSLTAAGGNLDVAASLLF